jgi:hypothetical protein
MHIAILLNDLSGGGVERTMLTLAGGFLSHGHAVDLVLRAIAGRSRPRSPKAPESSSPTRAAAWSRGWQSREPIRRVSARWRDRC